MFVPTKPEEFIVEEILPDGTQLEVGKQLVLGKPEDQALERDYFTHFILQKKDWNTLEALSALAYNVHAKPSRFNNAGNKDKKAITVQRCSGFAISPERLKGTKVKDVKLLGMWKAKDKVRLGDLAGNRFTITLTEKNCGKSFGSEEIVGRAREINYQIGNFFGRQRFGSQRGNTARIGENMLKGEYEQAVWEFLATGGEESGKITEARMKLREGKNFADALQYFPKNMRYERTVLAHLATTPSDFIGAFRKLSRHLVLLFIHAYQSELFNEFISKAEGDFVCDSDAAGFPDLGTTRARKESDEKEITRGKAFPVANIIGYQSGLSENEERFLESKGITKDFFKLKSMPELSSKGAFRPTRVPLNGFEVLETNPLKIRFSLPSGSYATVAMDQLLGE